MNPTARRSMVLALAFLVFQPAPVFEVPAAVGEEPKLQEVLDHIQTKARMLTSLSGRFSQQTQTRLLTAPVQSEGRLYWQRPDRLRWEVAEPAPLTLVARGASILVLYPDLKRAKLHQLPTRGDIIGRLAGTAEDLESLKRQYRIALAPVSGGDGDGLLQMTFEPATKWSARYLQQVEVKIDPATWLPREITIVGADHDVTTIHLLDLSENVELPASLFDIEPPSGYLVDGLQRTYDR